MSHIQDKNVNQWFRDSEKASEQTTRMFREYMTANATGAKVEPVTLTMQEYLDIKTMVEELREIDEILRHRNSDNTLIDGNAILTACSIARRLSLP